VGKYKFLVLYISLFLSIPAAQGTECDLTKLDGLISEQAALHNRLPGLYEQIKKDWNEYETVSKPLFSRHWGTSPDPVSDRFLGKVADARNTYVREVEIEERASLADNISEYAIDLKILEALRKSIRGGTLSGPGEFGLREGSQFYAAAQTDLENGGLGVGLINQAMGRIWIYPESGRENDDSYRNNILRGLKGHQGNIGTLKGLRGLNYDWVIEEGEESEKAGGDRGRLLKAFRLHLETARDLGYSSLDLFMAIYRNYEAQANTAKDISQDGNCRSGAYGLLHF